MAAFAGALAEAAKGQWLAAAPLGEYAYSYMDWKQRSAMQGRLEELERELLEVNGNAERLARSFSELVELQLVLEKASGFFDDAQHRASSAAFQTAPADSGSASSALLVVHKLHVCNTELYMRVGDATLACASVYMLVLCCWMAWPGLGPVLSPATMVVAWTSVHCLHIARAAWDKPRPLFCQALR